MLCLVAATASAAEKKGFEAQRTGEKMMADLNAAVELAGRGQVLTVLVRPESKPSRCFADLVKRDTFSAPPSGHFWVPVTIRFTEQ